ncbi:lysosomal enzyme trafficking factor isoform 1-T1 [Morphnus guianensis]
MLEAGAPHALLWGCPNLASPPPPHEAALALKRWRLGAGGHSHAGGNRRVNMGDEQRCGAAAMGVGRHFGRGQLHHREARARAKMAAGQPAPPRQARRGPAPPRPASARMQTGAHRKWFSPCRKCRGSGAVAGRQWQRAGSGAAGRWAPSPPGAAARAEGSGPPAVALPLPPSPLEEGAEHGE